VLRLKAERVSPLGDRPAAGDRPDFGAAHPGRRLTAGRACAQAARTSRTAFTGRILWSCHAMASAVLKRLVDRYGPDLIIVHGDATGVDESFGTAARGLGLVVEAHPAHWDRFGKYAGPKRNGEMVAAGADLCIAVHRFVFNTKGTKDCARRAIAAGIPTYLIDSDKANPKRLLADDPRIE
jgi:hypothetical protein